MQKNFNQRLIKPFVGALFICTSISGNAAQTVPFPANLPTVYPQGMLGDLVKQGKNIVEDTQHYAASNVGNGLNCAHCHIDNGRKPYAAPFVGLSGDFPKFLARDKKVITLQDRINGCFMRSMNGTALKLDSKEMLALTAYITWLSQGVPSGQSVEGRGFIKLDAPNKKPDVENGARVFANSCAMCHGAQGEGTYSASNVVFPALWGNKSYNDGAGMSKASVAARFIQHNMPFNAPGTLSTQDAYDVAAFIDSKPRPHFNPSHTAK